MKKLLILFLIIACRKDVPVQAPLVAEGILMSDNNCKKYMCIYNGMDKIKDLFVNDSFATKSFINYKNVVEGSLLDTLTKKNFRIGDSIKFYYRLPVGFEKYTCVEQGFIIIHYPKVFIYYVEKK